MIQLAAANGLRVIPDSWAVAGYFANNKVIGYLGTGLSPALLGVGYIVGLNVGIVVLSGAILSWHIAIPLYHAFFLGNDPQLAAGIAGCRRRMRPSRSGRPRSVSSASARCWWAGVWTLFSLRNSLLAGIKSGFAAARKSTGAASNEKAPTATPMKWMLVALVLFVLPLLALARSHRRPVARSACRCRDSVSWWRCRRSHLLCIPRHVSQKADWVKVCIADGHTNVVLIEKNGQL